MKTKSSIKSPWHHLQDFVSRCSQLHRLLNLFFLTTCFFCLISSNLSAQVLTAPKIYFPISKTSYIGSSGVTRYTAQPPGTKTDISAATEGTINGNTTNRSGSIDEAVAFVANSTRLKIANQSGSSTTTSFFGTTTTSGSDVAKFTISCWVYVDPTETAKRYLYYGADATNKVGFGLSLQGSDIYLVKYNNNVVGVPKGAALPTTVVGNTWEGKFWGPATFNGGAGWYQVILVQAAYYTRLFIGMPPNGNANDGLGNLGKFGKDFTGSMVMHGKQDLSSFTQWGIGAPVGNSTDAPIQKMDDFMVFDYDMTPAEAEALYRCQVDKTVDACLGTGNTYTQTFAFVSDYGCDGGSRDPSDTFTPSLTNPVKYVSDMIKSWSPEFILSGGDDNYPDSPDQSCSLDIKNNVGKYYGTYISSTATNNGTATTNKFFPAVGNHDYNCPGSNPPGSNKTCLSIWTDFFPTETYTINPGNEGRYYTFTQGNIQFFVINSNREEPDGNNFMVDDRTQPIYDNSDPPKIKGYKQVLSRQAAWINQQMQNSTATFKIVYTHFPPYAPTIGKGKNNSTAVSKWPFKDWGADIVLSGDIHWYERSDSSNLTYVTCGVGGFPGLEQLGTYKLVPGNRAHSEGKFGALRIQSNATTVHFRFYAIDASSATNANDRSKDVVLDEFYLNKRVAGSTYARVAQENTTDIITAAEQAEIETTAFPNPTTGDLTLRLYSKREDLVTMKLTDMTGRVFYSQRSALTSGVQEIPLGNLKANGIEAGVYLLQVETALRNTTIKIIVQ